MKAAFDYSHKSRHSACYVDIVRLDSGPILSTHGHILSVERAMSLEQQQSRRRSRESLEHDYCGEVAQVRSTRTLEAQHTVCVVLNDSAQSSSRTSRIISSFRRKTHKKQVEFAPHSERASFSYENSETSCENVNKSLQSDSRRRSSDLKRFFMKTTLRESVCESNGSHARLQQPRLSLLGKPLNYKPAKKHDPRYRWMQIRLNNFLERPRGFLAILYHLIE